MENNNTKEEMKKVKVKDTWNDDTYNLLLNHSQIRVLKWLKDNSILTEDIEIEILNENEVYNTV